MAAFRVGMELGDNRVSMGLMDEHGSLWSRKVFSGNGLQRPQHFVETLCDHLEDLLIRRGLAPGDLDQIGLGVAGAVDTPSGTVWYSPGLFGEKNIPLAGLMEEQIGVLPTVVSVGGAAAYAEMRFGQGAPDSFIYLSLDRTVECGIVLNGKIYTGPSRMAGQLGHMVAEPDGRPCVCGQRGCLNTCIGSSALVALGGSVFRTSFLQKKARCAMYLRWRNPATRTRLRWLSMALQSLRPQWQTVS